MLGRYSSWPVTSTPLFLFCLFKTKSKQNILWDGHLFNTSLWGTRSTILLCWCEWEKKWRGSGYPRRGINILEWPLWLGGGEELDHWNVCTEKKCRGGSAVRKNRKQISFVYTNPCNTCKERLSLQTSNFQITYHGFLWIIMIKEQLSTVFKVVDSGTRHLSPSLICHLVLVECQLKYLISLFIFSYL